MRRQLARPYHSGKGGPVKGEGRGLALFIPQQALASCKRPCCVLTATVCVHARPWVFANMHMALCWWQRLLTLLVVCATAQVAASAGVKLSEADAALKALAYDSLGNLEVITGLGPHTAHVCICHATALTCSMRLATPCRSSCCLVDSW